MGLEQCLRARSAGGRDTFLCSLISNATAGSDLDHAPEKEPCAISSPFLACGRCGWGVRRAKPAARVRLSPVAVQFCWARALQRCLRGFVLWRDSMQARGLCLEIWFSSHLCH